VKIKLGKIWWLVAAVIIVIVGVLVSRGISGEDDWICKDGAWQKHGNPNNGPPATTCEIK